jgi:hypothetical protein
VGGGVNMKAGRELDRLIEEKVMKEGNDPIPFYSTKYKDAFTVMRKLSIYEGKLPRSRGYSAWWFDKRYPGSKEPKYYVESKRLSHAICLVALKVAEFLNEDKETAVSDKSYFDFKLVPSEKVQYELAKRKKRDNPSGFRSIVLSKYKNTCAISGEKCSNVLQAAHIQPYVGEESDHVQNGIVLRIDLHKLFDDGLITINRNYRVIVSEKLIGSEYYSFHNRLINLPKDKHDWPSLEALNYHQAFIFNKNIN